MKMIHDAIPSNAVGQCSPRVNNGVDAVEDIMLKKLNAMGSPTTKPTKALGIVRIKHLKIIRYCSEMCIMKLRCYSFNHKANARSFLYFLIPDWLCFWVSQTRTIYVCNMQAAARDKIVSLYWIFFKRTAFYFVTPFLFNVFAFHFKFSLNFLYWRSNNRLGWSHVLVQR